MSARRKLAVLLTGAALLLCVLAPASAQAAFGFHSLEVDALNQNGSPDLLAGSHPFEWRLSWKMNADGEGEPEGEINQLKIELPPGMIGNPQAVTSCPLVLFEGGTPLCPGSSQIGVVRAKLAGAIIPVPIYNLDPPLGVAARFGVTILSIGAFQDASIRTGGDYGATAYIPAFPALNVESISASIWGVPALTAHDTERFCPQNFKGEPGCLSEKPPAPFFTLPTSCTGPLKTTISMDSRQEPGAFQTQTSFSRDALGNEAGLVDCEAPRFEPTLAARPETSAADSPTGLHVEIAFPQSENTEGRATANLKDTVLTLPSGLAVNPSAADGMAACSSAQADLQGPGPANCPPASRLGTVAVRTPLLDHPLPGSVYLAKQIDNPFGSLLAIYIAVSDPISGAVVKLAGKVEPNLQTGKLQTTFLNNPQLPFEEFSVDFTGGPRASLTTPFTCGSYKTEAALVPWTSPAGKTAFLSDSFPVGSAPGGAACPVSEAGAPNNPTFEAGTTTPLAGSYSPLVLKLSRENGAQHLGALNLALPPGLVAKFAGVGECSEAQIAQAQGRNRLGEGALEKASPSCPQASELGTVNVGVGSGSPFYVQGRVYLAGPYKGAPFSTVIITPGVAGPFDLGTTVVRAALYVNETTGQGTIKSDPFPQSLFGIPLDLRSVAVRIDRSQFSLNPTSCEAKAISAEAISAAGAVAQLSNHFQVGGCKGLDFSPKLSVSLKGGTKRAQHPAVKAVLTQPAGQANIASLSATLPSTEFIDQGHIGNPCTRPQFAAGNCPPISVLGTVKAYTPLFDEPLTGKLYFRTNGGERELPDVVADLNGPVHLVSVGYVDAVHKKGSETSRIRNTFAFIPDAPVSKIVLEFKGGKSGLLVNSQNLCKTTVPQRMLVKIKGHNGKSLQSEPLIANSCPKKASRRARSHDRR